MSRTVSASARFTTNLRFKTSYPRGGLPPIQMPLRLEAANLSRIRLGFTVASAIGRTVEESRTLHPDEFARLGLCQSFRHVTPTRCRAAVLEAPLQLASPAWQNRRLAAYQQTRSSREQPVEAPQRERLTL